MISRWDGSVSEHSISISFHQTEQKSLSDSSLRLNPLGPSLRSGCWNECTVIFFKREYWIHQQPRRSRWSWLGTKWRVMAIYVFLSLIERNLQWWDPQPPFLVSHSSTLSPRSIQFPPGPIWPSVDSRRRLCFFFSMVPTWFTRISVGFKDSQFY